MQMVAALSTDGSFITAKGKGSIEDASLFYINSNPLQTIAFDAYRNSGAVMVKVNPVEKRDGHLTIMTMNGKPLAFLQAHDEIQVFDRDEPEFESELAVWLEKRHFDRFADEYGLKLDGATPMTFGLRMAGYLTKEDEDTWLKAQ